MSNIDHSDTQALLDRIMVLEEILIGYHTMLDHASYDEARILMVVAKNRTRFILHPEEVESDMYEQMVNRYREVREERMEYKRKSDEQFDRLQAKRNKTQKP
jgi:hypothetical protein